MSKFTKALEKIQIGKEKKAVPSDKEVSPVEYPSTVEERPRLWDNVRMIKNIKPDNRIVAYHFPNSQIAEQYRLLRTNLKVRFEKDQAKVILVSSSIRGEGKTITSTNLALFLAETGESKVALIDADLRRGKVADYLGLGKNLPGLSNLLNEGLNVKQVMVRNSVQNLLVMTRGTLAKNPSELISSNQMRALIAELRNHFDFIIIDSPPIMSVADANILGREVDGLLMVIQSGRTPKSVISHAHLLFKQAGIRLLGYILTNVEFQSAGYRYYYHYYNQDVDTKKKIKTWADFRLKDLEKKLRKVEDGFNDWWENKVLKNKFFTHSGETKNRNPHRMS